MKTLSSSLLMTSLAAIAAPGLALASEKHCYFNTMCTAPHPCQNEIVFEVALQETEEGMLMTNLLDRDETRYQRLGAGRDVGFFVETATEDQGRHAALLSLHADGTLMLSVHSAGQIHVAETFTGTCEVAS